MKYMNGQVINGTSICVDYWNWMPEKKFKRFLSHLHADHTVKLSSTFREDIYTSPFNAWLVKKWFNIDPDLVVALDVGVPNLMYDENTNQYFNVTLIDANHCPGSVMFLFQGSFGSILYTSDFRYSPEMLNNSMLKPLIENEALNQLYLDNTFAAEYCEFPPRKEALQEVLTLIRHHPDHFILIGLRKLGKEEVLLEIALDLKEKILVSNEKLEILKYLQFKSVYTTDPTQSRILVKSIHQINSSYIQKLKEEKGPVLTILLTALYSVWPPGEKYSKMQDDKVLGIHRIPYSDHSCHSELVEFVSKVKPDTIYPIVKVKVPNEENSSEYNKNSLNFLSLSSVWRNSVIPVSILRLCKIPQTCAERNEEVSSCFVNKVAVNMGMIPYQLTEDESKSSLSELSQNKNEVCANNLKDKDSLKMLMYPTNIAELNELDMCDNASMVRSEEWFSLSDEEMTQKSTVVNSIALPTSQRNCKDKIVCNFANTEVSFINKVESRLPLLTYNCVMTDDEKLNQEQVIPMCSSEVNSATPSEELSQLKYTSHCLVLQPAQHSEVKERESTTSKRNENINVEDIYEKCVNAISCTAQSSGCKKIKCSTPITVKNRRFFYDLTTQPAPIQNLSKVSPVTDKKTNICNDINHVIGDCSKKETSFILRELPPQPKVQLISDLIDLSTVPNSDHLVPKCTINLIDQSKDIKPVLTSAEKVSNHLLFSPSLLGENTASFTKSPLIPTLTHLLDLKEEDDETMMNNSYRKNLLSETFASSQKSQLDNKINKSGKIKKTYLTFKSNKKIRISEKFKSLLVESQTGSNNDSFCEAIATSRNEYRPSDSSVKDESLKALVEGKFEYNDPLYQNLDYALATWKESVRSQCSTSNLNVKPQPYCKWYNGFQKQHWDDYDWKRILKRS